MFERGRAGTQKLSARQGCWLAVPLPPSTAPDPLPHQTPSPQRPAGSTHMHQGCPCMLPLVMHLSYSHRHNHHRMCSHSHEHSGTQAVLSPHHQPHRNPHRYGWVPSRDPSWTTYPHGAPQLGTHLAWRRRRRSWSHGAWCWRTRRRCWQRGGSRHLGCGHGRA